MSAPPAMPARASSAAVPGAAPRTIATSTMPPTSCSAARSASTVIAAGCRWRGASEVIGRLQAREDAIAHVVGPGGLEARDRRRAGGGVDAEAHNPEDAGPAGALH